MKTSLIFGMIGLMALGACSQPTLEQYRPVTDPYGPRSATYERDLNMCYSVAKRAEGSYRQQRNAEMGTNVAVGAIGGALIGAAFGNSDWAAIGATYGAASGVATTNTELARGGPRRIIDRCMADRGHRIYSDFGRG